MTLCLYIAIILASWIYRTQSIGLSTNPDNLDLPMQTSVDGASRSDQSESHSAHLDLSLQKEACMNTFYQEIDLVRSYFRSAEQTQEMRNALFGAATAQKGMRNRDVLEEIATTACGELISSRIALADYVSGILLAAPEHYALWQLPAHFLIKRFTLEGQKTVGTTKDGAGVGDITEDLLPGSLSEVLVLGLSMFPSSPELLAARALQLWTRHGSDDVRNSSSAGCAGYFAAAAVRSMRFWGQHRVGERDRDGDGSSSCLAGLAAQQRDVEKAMEDIVYAAEQNEGSDNSGCVPQLEAHNRQAYQHTYKAISGVYQGNREEDWAELRNRSNLFELNSLVPSAIVAAHYADGVTPSLHLPSLQVGCADPLRCPQPGFLIADAVHSVSTHFVTQAYDLRAVQDSSVGLVYSSHTLEHLSHNLPPPTCPSYPKPDPTGTVKGCSSEIQEALREWRRLLPPGGQLLVSAPDLEALAGYFTSPSTGPQLRAVIGAIVFGGQHDEHDFHKTGLFYALIKELLRGAGFCEVERVPELALFADTSDTLLAPGMPLSVNVRAVAC